MCKNINGGNFMKTKGCVSAAVAAVIAATALAPMAAFAADETAIEFQPFGTIIHNSADDLADFSKLSDSFAAGMGFVVDTTATPNKEPGLYLNNAWHNAEGDRWGDGKKTTTDIPDPYLTWQVTKGSKVDLVVYQQGDYADYLKFEVSEDGKTWTEVSEITKTVVNADNKAELGLEDVVDAEYFGIYDYAFTMPDDSVLVKVTVNPDQFANHYSFQITKFRAKDGTTSPEKLTFDSEIKISGTVDDVLADTDSASNKEAFEMGKFNGSEAENTMTVAYSYVADNKAPGEAIEKPYVIYKVDDNSNFALTAALYDKAMRMGMDFTLYTSADKSSWTKAEAQTALYPTAEASSNKFNAYKDYAITVPEGHHYVKVEYPQSKNYKNEIFPYTISDIADEMAYVAGISAVKFDKFVEDEDNDPDDGNTDDNTPDDGSTDDNTPAEPEAVKPDTTVTFTGTDADFSKMFDYNKDAIDLTQKVANKSTVMVKYDYLLGKTDAEPMYMTFNVSERSPFIAKVYLHTNARALGWAPKFYVSADNKSWTEVAATATTVSEEIEGFPGWIDMTYTIDEIPAGNKYVKVEYPQTKDMTGTSVPGGGTVGDPLNYGVAVYELQFAKGGSKTGVTDFAVIAFSVMIVSAAAAAYVVLNKKQHQK